MAVQSDRVLRATAAFIVAILAGLTGLHVYWALGGDWGLARALGGNEVPPTPLVWAVALFLAGAAFVVSGRAGVWGHRLPERWFARGTWVVAGAFGLGAAANFAGRTALERWGFAPLSLAVAILVVSIARSHAGRRPARTPVALDAWLPRFSVREYHECLVDCRPEDALDAALRLPVAPDRVVRTLFRLRGYGAPDESIGEFTSTNGFVVLEQTPTTYTFGMAARLRGTPRQASDPDGWLSWPATGVKIVADFRAEAAGDARARLVTETRVLALDSASLVLFRLYWVVVGPFSALIRRRWLRAIAVQAARRP